MTGCCGGVTGSFEKGGGHCLGKVSRRDDTELCLADGYRLYRQ